jgi:hypothetical protein
LQIGLRFKVIFVDKLLAPGDNAPTLCLLHAFFTGRAMDDKTVWAASIGVVFLLLGCLNDVVDTRSGLP